MPNNVDKRIVEMQFDNNQFEKGIKQSTDSLEGLKKSLDFSGIAKTGLQLAKVVDTTGTISSVEKTANALESLKAKVPDAVKVAGKAMLGFGKAATVSLAGVSTAVTAMTVKGGWQRAMNMRQANFMLKGIIHDEKQLNEITEAINRAVKGTIYGLDEASLVASQLVASGVTSGKQLESILLGAEGLASTYGIQFSRVGEIYSQMAASGRLYQQDLMMLMSNGVPVYDTLAKYMTKVGDGAEYTQQQIKDMVSNGDIQFDQFAAAMTDTFGSQATEAGKLFTGALANVHAALNRIGEKITGPVIDALRDVFNAIQPLINIVNEQLTPVFDRWGKIVETAGSNFVGFFNSIGNDDKGVGVFSSAVSNILALLGKIMPILGTVKTAFLDVFDKPATSIQELSDRFTKFTEKFKVSDQLLGNLKSTFEGVFTILKIFGKTLKSIAILLAPFVKGLLSLVDAAIAITGRMGDIVVKIDTFLKKTGVLKTAFAVLSAAGQTVMTVFSGLAHVVRDVFSAFGEGSFAKHVKSFADFGKVVAESFGNVGTTLTGKFPQLKKILDDVSRGFTNFGNSIKTAFSKADFSFLSDLFTAGGVVAIFKTIKDFIDSLSGTFEGGVGFLSGVKDCLDGLKDTFEAYQKTLDAVVLLKIAQAIAILAGSILVLSFIDPKRLVPALAAMEVMLFSVFKTMNALGSIGDGKGGVKAMANMAKLGTVLVAISVSVGILSAALLALSRLSIDELIIGLTGLAGACLILVAVAQNLASDDKKIMKGATSLIAFALAINVLSQAVNVLGTLSPEELFNGLGSVMILLASIGFFVNALDKKGAKNLDRSAGAMVLMAGSLFILAQAVKALGSLKVEELGKGLGAVAVLMFTLSKFTNKLGKGGSAKMKVIVAELFVLAGAILIMADAVKKFSGMNMDELGRGLLGLAVSLGAMVTALGVMSTMDNTGKSAVSLILLATAITILSKAIGAMGGMSMEEIGHSMLTLAGGLSAIIIALGVMSTMKGGASSAGAILIMAGAIAVLAPALQTLGNMSLEQIGKSLLAIAGAFTVFGVAAAVLAATGGLVAILGLSAAMAAIGIAAVAAGAGVALFASGLAALAALGPASIDNIVESIKSLATGIPEIFKYLALGIVQMIAVLGASAGQLAAVGLTLLVALLSSIRDNIYQITDLALQIITGFVNAIAVNMPIIVESGINLMVSFINALAEGIRGSQEIIFEAIGNLTAAIITFFLSALQSLVAEIPVIGDDLANGLEKAKKTVDDNFNTKEGSKSGEGYGKGISEGVGKSSDKTKKSAEKHAKAAAAGAKDTKLMKAAAEGMGSSYSTALGKAASDTKTAGEKFPIKAAAGASGKASSFSSPGTKGANEYIKGLDKANVAKAGKTVAGKAKTGMGSVTGYDGLGSNAAAGFVRGASSKNSQAGSAGWALASSYYNAIKKRLQEHSPSKETAKLAKWAVLGFVNESNKNLKLTETAGMGVAAAMLHGIQKKSKSISGAVDQMDFVPNNPVITPVIDLTNVRSAAGEIGSIFAGNRSIQASANIGGGLTAMNAQRNAMSDLVSAMEKKLDNRPNNNVWNIRVDGAENPEAYVKRFVGQFKTEMRG